MDILKHNQSAWDLYVDKKDRWTIPVSHSEIENAKKGNWNIRLTPTKPVPHNWFPDLAGLKVLGLASGGGQQGPILATLGADITIFDNSEKQLAQDRNVSETYDLTIKTVQGDMKDLSVFPDGMFDLIFNPCSILFVEDVAPVWKECYRVLKPNGILLAGLINPIAFQLDEETFILTYHQPFSDLHSLASEKVEELKKNLEPLSFGHSLSDQIGGQLEAGFLLTGMYEDNWAGESKFDNYFPSFIATRALKPSY